LARPQGEETEGWLDQSNFKETLELARPPGEE
jgi:hypothetical protein